MRTPVAAALSAKGKKAALSSRKWTLAATQRQEAPPLLCRDGAGAVVSL